MASFNQLSINELTEFDEGAIGNTQYNGIPTPDQRPYEILSNKDGSSRNWSTVAPSEMDAKVTEAGLDNSLIYSNLFLRDHVIDSPESCLSRDVGDNAADKMFAVCMEVQLPIESIKDPLQEHTKKDLSCYTFWLFNEQMLDPLDTLVDKCVECTGSVQVNGEILDELKRIVIHDVVKPLEEQAITTNSEPIAIDTDIEEPSPGSSSNSSNETNTEASSGHSVDEDGDEGKNQLYANWVKDERFLNLRKRHNIPCDPRKWTEDHLKIWLVWAIDEFKLEIDINDWIMNGKMLHELSFKDFQSKVRRDPDNTFWIHLEVLRKSKCVGVPGMPPQLTNKSIDSITCIRNGRVTKKSFETNKRSGLVTGNPIRRPWNTYGNANNGKYSLWKFLFDILTDKEHQDIIQWVGYDGKFRLIQPQAVAALWGRKKNKPKMNYDKLSRALRYYYEDNIILKVDHEMYTYKFGCDLKEAFGFNVKELIDLTNGVTRTPRTKRRFAEPVTW